MEFTVFPEKAQFGAAEEIAVRAELRGCPGRGCRVRLTLYRLGEKRAVQEKAAAPAVRFLFPPEEETDCLQGYLAEATLLSGEGVLARAHTACDRAAGWQCAPRYGFLSDFGKEERDDDRDVLAMNRLHLNAVQFYDWMYRHDDFFPPENESDEFQDVMGRRSSMETVRRKIDLLHRHHMKAFAYGAVYGAEDYADAHPACALRNDRREPMRFIDRITLMDIHRTCEWHRHILDEYRKAVRFGFDGIHMDQYGSPKEAWGLENGKFVLRRLRDDFPALIDDVRAALPESGIIFNAVNDWPVDAVAGSGQDCVYIEVWPPNDTYRDLNRLISDAKKYAPSKQVVLAAYLRPYGERAGADPRGCTARLTMAAIFSSGGFHLLLGERNGVLTEAYYPNHHRLCSAEGAEVFRCWYDFITAYEELLFLPGLIDDTRTCAGGINTEYRFSGASFSVEAEPGSVWTQVKHGRDYRVIHLVNFTGIGNMNWNEAHPSMPDPVRGITVETRIPEETGEVVLASPDLDHGMGMPLGFTREIGDDGAAVVRFTVPELRIWDIIFIRNEADGGRPRTSAADTAAGLPK